MPKGACLCRAVRFEVAGELPHPAACHCTICRRLSGHYAAWADIPWDRLKIFGEETLTWFQSSETVRRGFCSVCGSQLFFDPLNLGWTSVAMGALDGQGHAHLEEHIHVADKGDYYDIADGLPQRER